MSEMHVRCAYTKLVPLHELKQHQKNRNKHNREQIDRLSKILKYQGWRSPIKVSNRSGCITSGHGRLMAALHLGWIEAPVDFQDYESDEQEYADVIADNEIARWASLDLAGVNLDLKDLGPDFDIDLLGISGFELDILPPEPLTDEDDVPEHVEPKAKLGDIYKLGNHRLMCGDATSIDAVEALMAGEKADMVFTDPPYGVKVAISDGKQHGNALAKRNKFDPILNDETTQVAIDSYNLCACLGIETMIFWGANYYAEALPPSPCWIVWDKQNDGNQFADAELAWVNRSTPVRICRHMWNGMIKASEHGERRVHPTQKPIALAEWAFEEFCEDARSVLDLFGGSGSTLIACEKTARKCFMMELDPKYIDVIVARWEAYTGRKAELLNGTA